jgi:hypothetical protein
MGLYLGHLVQRGDRRTVSRLQIRFTEELGRVD